MWMMGCSDVSDSLKGRRLAPVLPRSSSTTSTNISSNLGGATTAATHPYLGRLHGNDLLVLNHHLAAVSEQSKRDFSAAPTTLVSTRWNPTPEQLQTLEELYRRGTRTPSAEQIQQITAQLRRFGKIEGKNVFYWFQNHKARERQKRRRRSKSTEEEHHHHHYHQGSIETIENKESGSSRTNFEVHEQQAKHWGFSTNFSTVAQDSVSMQRAERAAEISERIQFEEAQQVQQRRLVDRHAMWQMMQLSCSPPTTAPRYMYTTASSTTSAAVLGTLLNPAILNTQYLNISKEAQSHEHVDKHEESQTLQLFPAQNSGGGGKIESGPNVAEKASDELPCIETVNTNSSPKQFFEFL